MHSAHAALLVGGLKPEERRGGVGKRSTPVTPGKNPRKNRVFGGSGPPRAPPRGGHETLISRQNRPFLPANPYTLPESERIYLFIKKAAPPLQGCFWGFRGGFRGLFSPPCTPPRGAVFAPRTGRGPLFRVCTLSLPLSRSTKTPKFPRNSGF